MEALKKIIYFTRECNYTSRQEKMYYWVEIDENHMARFFRKGISASPSFYSEYICNAEDETHLKHYLQILLKARIMIEEN